MYRKKKRSIAVWRNKCLPPRNHLSPPEQSHPKSQIVIHDPLRANIIMQMKVLILFSFLLSWANWHVIDSVVAT